MQQVMVTAMEGGESGALDAEGSGGGGGGGFGGTKCVRAECPKLNCIHKLAHNNNFHFKTQATNTERFSSNIQKRKSVMLTSLRVGSVFSKIGLFFHFRHLLRK